jgi:hypothetical protein
MRVDKHVALHDSPKPLEGRAHEKDSPFLTNVGLAGGFLDVAADARMRSLRRGSSLNPR